MSYNTRVLRCAPSDVFRVLGDGWLYPGWVVGASRMRAVDSAWPRPGASLHHSFGVWPALLNDTTLSVEWAPPTRMVVIAKGWPAGEARVTIEVRGHPEGCLVGLEEHPVKGPGVLMPQPLGDLLLFWRNSETLRRLSFLATGIGERSTRDESAPAPATSRR